jgi:uncharacterized protein
MKMKSLPQYIQPIRMAERGVALSGTLPLSGFLRMHDLLAHQDGEIIVDLQLDKDESQWLYIKGTLRGQLSLVCQRCLQPMDYALMLPVSLSPVFSKEAGEKLPPRYEPLLLEEDQLLLCDFVEEELLLGLPSVPKHEYGTC